MNRYVHQTFDSIGIHKNFCFHSVCRISINTENKEKEFFLIGYVTYSKMDAEQVPK